MLHLRTNRSDLIQKHFPELTSSLQNYRHYRLLVLQQGRTQRESLLRPSRLLLWSD